MPRLELGQMAPDFTLKSDTDEAISLTSLRGHVVVIYFYPKAMTSGCTTQACDYRDRLKDFSTQGVTVLGISPDPVSRLAAFREAEGLTFPLLSDESHEVLESYGVWVEKSMYGKTYMGVERSTFVVDAGGAIVHVNYKVKASGDAERVLGMLK